MERQRKRENIEDGLCTVGFEEGRRVWILQKAFNSGETEIPGLTHVELYDNCVVINHLLVVTGCHSNCKCIHHIIRNTRLLTVSSV